MVGCGLQITLWVENLMMMWFWRVPCKFLVELHPKVATIGSAGQCWQQSQNYKMHKVTPKFPTSTRQFWTSPGKQPTHHKIPVLLALNTWQKKKTDWLKDVERKLYHETMKLWRPNRGVEKPLMFLSTNSWQLTPTPSWYFGPASLPSTRQLGEPRQHRVLNGSSRWGAFNVCSLW